MAPGRTGDPCAIGGLTLSIRRLILGSAVVLLAVAALALLASPASAVIYKDGDWVVNGVESYTGETIIVNNTTTSDGNLIITSLGNLTLENCTVFLPFNRTFDNQGVLHVRDSRLDGANWFFYLRGPAFIENTVIHNATHQLSGGFTGTYIADADVHFDDVTWTRSAPRPSAYRYSIIHVRVVTDFQNVELRSGSGLSYELSPISGTAVIDISNISIIGSTSSSYRTKAIRITPVSHPGNVFYNIHDINITYPDDGIDLRASSTSTVYNIYNITVQGMYSSAFEIGDVGQSRFSGQLNFDNISVVTTGGWGGGTRAIRAFGTTSAVITVNDLTVSGGGRGVWTDGCTAVVTDSTMANGGYQFFADDDSHIYVYRTSDNPALTATGSRASVEHMAFLNIVGVAWQGGVPFDGDVLQLRNATGRGNLDIDPATWTPQFSVLWGRYSGQGVFDNRDLWPRVVDGTRTFPCSPGQFYFTETMGPLSITCNDNWGPTLSVNFPEDGGVVNQSTFTADGVVIDLGSGLSSVAWSFDNVSWTPITIPVSGQNWSAVLTDVADDRYYLYLRAIDRVGHSFYVTVGPFLVDTSPPVFTLPVPPDYVTGANYTLDSYAEPQATVSFRSITGLVGQTTVPSTGEWTLVLPLSEGLNVFTITAVDQAGNTVTKTFSLVVDHTPPALSVFLENVTYTAEQTLLVTGLAESNSTVVVNGIIAPRTDEEFTYGVLLASGSNDIFVVATDGAGNLREWMGRAIYDNVEPDLTVVVSTSGGITSQGAHITTNLNVAVGGQVTDTITGVAWLSINGIKQTLTQEGAITSTVEVTEGMNDFTVVAADLAGNTAQFEFSVLRDGTLPTATVAIRTDDTVIVVLNDMPHTSEATISLVVTMSEAGTVTMKSQPHHAVAGENVYIVTLAEGQNVFDFLIQDLAGNAGLPQTLAVVRDSTGPTISVSKPLNGAVIVGTSFTVEGTVENGSTVFVNGEEVPVSPSGVFTTTLPLSNGTTGVTVEAYDLLGNPLDNPVSLSVTKGEEFVPPVVAEADYTMSIMFLAVGIGAGVGIGFLLRARGASAMRAKLEEAEGGGPLPPPTGPRGPQPPGSP